MNTKTFFNFYDLTSIEVIEIKKIQSGLSIILNTHLDQFFVGNGFRSSFDEAYYHQFIFPKTKDEISITSPIIIKDYQMNNGVISINANGINIELIEQEIIINSNYRIK